MPPGEQLVSRNCYATRLHTGDGVVHKHCEGPGPRTWLFIAAETPHHSCQNYRVPLKPRDIPVPNRLLVVREVGGDGSLLHQGDALTVLLPSVS